MYLLQISGIVIYILDRECPIILVSKQKQDKRKEQNSENSKGNTLEGRRSIQK